MPVQRSHYADPGEHCRPVVPCDQYQSLHRGLPQQAANASVAHFSEGDLLRAGEGGHADIRAPKLLRWKPLDLVAE
jgi:hypothetical protein